MMEKEKTMNPKNLKKKLLTDKEKIDQTLDKALELIHQGTNQMSSMYNPLLNAEPTKPQTVERPTPEFLCKVNAIFDVLEGLTLAEAMNILSSVEGLITMQSYKGMGAYYIPPKRVL